MFCLSCRTMKAEAGCYLAGMETRVCLECYRAAVGTMPLPSNASPAIGGAFADGGRLAEFSQRGSGSLAEKMNRVSEAVAEGAAGVGEVWDRTRGQAREAKEAFWRQMPEPIQEYRNQANRKRVEIRDEARSKINEVEERVKEAADGLLKPLELLF